MDTPRRTMRIDNQLWDAARKAARQDGTTVTAVTIAALTTFVAQGVSTETH